MRKLRLVFEIEVDSLKKLPASVHIPNAVRKQLEAGKTEVLVKPKRRSRVSYAYGNPIAALRRFVEGK
jgi:hypothetical protein